VKKGLKHDKAVKEKITQLNINPQNRRIASEVTRNKRKLKD